jgi:hypothetical protein
VFSHPLAEKRQKTRENKSKNKSALDFCRFFGKTNPTWMLVKRFVWCFESPSSSPRDDQNRDKTKKSKKIT